MEKGGMWMTVLYGVPHQSIDLKGGGHFARRQIPGRTQLRSAKPSELWLIRSRAPKATYI